MIPGLEQAEFVRYGQMHRNTFIASPLLLEPTLQIRPRAASGPALFFAGQITGVEGYMGNIATGLLAGMNAARLLSGLPPLALPVTTMLGALTSYITRAEMKDFQPMKANFGILPPLEQPGRTKPDRSLQYVQRGQADLEAWAAANELPSARRPTGRGEAVMKTLLADSSLDTSNSAFSNACARR